MLVKTVFMLKHLDARNAADEKNKHTNTLTDIATYRLGAESVKSERILFKTSFILCDRIVEERSSTLAQAAQLVIIMEMVLKLFVQTLK